MRPPRRELSLSPIQEKALTELADAYAVFVSYQERKDRSALSRKAAGLFSVLFPQKRNSSRLRSAVPAALCALCLLGALLFALTDMPGRPAGGKTVFVSGAADMSSVRTIPLPETEEPSSLIPVNSASWEELTALPGVGPSLARKIVEERETNGLFYLPEDLLSVSGIGEKTLEKLRPLISLELPEQ